MPTTRPPSWPRDVHDTALVGRRDLPSYAVCATPLPAPFSTPNAINWGRRNTWPYSGKARLKQAALDGDAEWGRVELGQSAGLISRIEPAAAVMDRLVRELAEATGRLRAMAG